MVKNGYSRQPKNPSRSVKAKGEYLRVHFKNTSETANAIRGLTLRRAQKYLNDVIKHKDIIPFRRFTGCIGRKAQAQKYNNNGGQGRWPEKSCRFLLDLLRNAESNAETQGLDVDTLFVSHAQVNRAPRLRRRTYRAHGRIGPYMASPCHIELVLTQKDKKVSKPGADSGVEVARKNDQGRLQSGSSAQNA